MHTTIVKTKCGKTYSGAICYFRPAFNWFSIWCNEDNCNVKKFYFDECESVITPHERIHIYSPLDGEEQDEMLRAKSNLDAGRKYGWKEEGVDYPKEKFEWEEKYEPQKI